MSNPTTTCVDCGEPRRSEQSPRCPACRKRRVYARIRAWQIANPEKMRKRTAQWRKDNPDWHKEYRRQWAANNREKVSEYNRRFYYANQEKELERARKRRKADPGMSKRWRDSNLAHAREQEQRYRDEHPEKGIEREHKRRARKRNAYVAPVTAADIAHLMEQQRGRCPYCQCSIRDGYHVDHYVPLAKGGTHEPANVQLTCPTCNSRKGAKLPEAFAQERGKLF